MTARPSDGSTRASRMAAAARCRDRGMTPAAIARFLGVSREVVARYLRQWDRDHDREHQEDQ